MLDLILGVGIFLPVAAGLVCMGNKACLIRPVVALTGVILILCSIFILGTETREIAVHALFGLDADLVVALLDFGLLFYILWLALKMKSRLLTILAVLQILPLAVLEVFMGGSGSSGSALYVDELSRVMFLVICVVGSLICFYGLHYMQVHEEHLHLERSHQGRFFLVMLVFLGAMNGLVLANDLLWIYFFWEVTTLCSFLLIGHDGTDEARANARRALWMNMLGGVAFVLALIMLSAKGLPLFLQELIARRPEAELVLFPLGLLCFAGFTKAAQMPFQSWLCGAMVAPTPVSALLHSSTMVKAGVYLILRLAPAFQDTVFSKYVALYGAFTFIATAVLALSQRNGKKILAYSTIGNLGLIVACAGINTPAAMAAGILLIIYHALSKGLMFLCVGFIEQHIGSRNIEDMRGLVSKLPKTTMITLVAMLTLFLPPFGVLLSKWMALEASAGLPLVVVLLALGSAFTVVFWARWAGMLLTSVSTADSRPAEKFSMLVSIPLYSLAGAALVISFIAPLVYTELVLPFLSNFYSAGLYEAARGVIFNNIGMFAIYPIFVVLGIGVLSALKASGGVRSRAVRAPYVGGLQDPQDERRTGFLGPMGQWVEFTTGNYYLEAVLGEGKITQWLNLAAIGILIVLLAGVL